MSREMPVMDSGSAGRQAPLLPWTVRDRLLLCDLVQKYGNQSWPVISRHMRHDTTSVDNPDDWYSARQCATQYNNIIEKVETPRRHRRNEAALESPEVKLARELREKRTTELKRQLEEDQRTYRKLTTDMIKADTAGEPDLAIMLADLEAWKKRHDEYEARLSRHNRSRRTSYRASRSQPGSPLATPGKGSASMSAGSTPLRQSSSARGSTSSTPYARGQGRFSFPATPSQKEQQKPPAATGAAATGTAAEPATTGTTTAAAATPPTANVAADTKKEVGATAAGAAAPGVKEESQATGPEPKGAAQEKAALEGRTITREKEESRDAGKTQQAQDAQAASVGSENKGAAGAKAAKTAEGKTAATAAGEAVKEDGATKQEQVVAAAQEEAEAQAQAEGEQATKGPKVEQAHAQQGEAVAKQEHEREEGEKGEKEEEEGEEDESTEQGETPSRRKTRSSAREEGSGVSTRRSSRGRTTPRTRTRKRSSAAAATESEGEAGGETASGRSTPRRLRRSHRDRAKGEETGAAATSTATAGSSVASSRRSSVDKRTPRGSRAESPSRVKEEPSEEASPASSAMETPVTSGRETPTTTRRSLRTRSARRGRPRRSKLAQVAVPGRGEAEDDAGEEAPQQDKERSFNVEELDDDAPLAPPSSARRRSSRKRELPKSILGHTLELVTPVTHELKEKWEVEDLSEEELERSQRMWRHSIMTVWRQIAGHKDANLFRHPVKVEHAPGYYDIVKRPMDLGTIEQQIKNKEITTTRSFEHALMQMLANAAMFNAEDHFVHVAAQEMKDDTIAAIEGFKQARLAVITDDGEERPTRGRRKKVEGDDDGAPTPKRTRSSKP